MDALEQLGQAGQNIIDAYVNRGGQIIEATDDIGALPYAGMADNSPYQRMKKGAGDAETLTGLAAMGAVIILAPGDTAHWGDQAVVPVLRVSPASTETPLVDGSLKSGCVRIGWTGFLTWPMG